MCYHSVDLFHPLTAAVASVDFRFGQLFPPRPRLVARTGLDPSQNFRTCISKRVTLVIQMGAF
jgi:hypothetical protein